MMQRRNTQAKTQPNALRVVGALTEWDERVLASITTNKPEGVVNWMILPNEYGAGVEISRSLQKLKRRGLAVIVRKHRGDTWWKASQRPNEALSGGGTKL